MNTVKERMGIKQKILFRIALLMMITTVIIIVNVVLNFRDYAIETAKDKASIVSGLVKDGLTSHMVNGTMDKRDSYLANIYRVKDVNRLWIVRGQKVIDQFGAARTSELPRDAIDRQVLTTGKQYDYLSETKDSAVLRVTIPYTATATDNPSCISCHNVRNGDVLGVISMEFDVAKIRQEGITTVLHIALISLVSLLVIMGLAGRLLNPYLEIFESLKNAVKAAFYGDFTKRVDTDLKDEAGETAQQFNALMDKFNDTFGVIDSKLGVLVPHQESNRDPLNYAKETVSELANVYQFKKAIENDKDKNDIYGRLVFIIRERFGIASFCIKELDTKEKVLKTVWQEGQGFCPNHLTSAEECRAKRTDSIVASYDFPGICPSYCGSGKHYVCIPATIAGTVGLVLTISSDTQEGEEKVRQALPFIRGYINEAVPVIEAKILMEALKDTSLKDALTGLYNRRYLEEYLDRAVVKVKKEKNHIAFLMIDIDYFKMVNDTYGHDVGDMVIKEIAKILQTFNSEKDLAVRYGGEEFLVVLKGVSNDEAIQKAEAIRQKVEDLSIKTSHIVLKKTISIGISFFPDDTEAVWQCIKFADIALYKAKQQGRNRVIRFNEEMWSKAGDY